MAGCGKPAGFGNLGSESGVAKRGGVQGRERQRTLTFLEPTKKKSENNLGVGERNRETLFVPWTGYQLINYFPLIS